MLNRLLLALDQFDTGQAALEFTGQVAHATHASVRVLHVRELEMLGRVPALETVEEAERLVREAVFRLRLNGVPADGRVRSCATSRSPVASPKKPTGGSAMPSCSAPAGCTA